MPAGYISTAGTAGTGAGAGASGAGVVAGVPLAVATSGRANKRKQATNFVNNFENAFGAELAQIELLARSNPAAANQALKQAWEKFLTDSAGFANVSLSGQNFMEPNRANAVNQALSNPLLIQTVNTLWNQTGGQGLLTDTSPSFMSNVTARPNEPGLGGGYPRIGGWTLADIMGTVNSAVRGTPGYNPGANTPGQDGGSGGGSVSGSGSGSGGGGTGGGGNSGGGGGVGNDKGGFKMPDWETLAPWILAAGGLVTSLYGGITGSNAAKEAAEIEAKSAEEGRKMIQGMYDTSRQDQMPWLQTGQASLATLSNLMGLPESQANPYTSSAPFGRNAATGPVPIRAARTLGSSVGGRR